MRTAQCSRIERCELSGRLGFNTPREHERTSIKEQDRFFRGYEVLGETIIRFDNIVYAYVHWDETTPHLHAGVTHVSMIRRKRGLNIFQKSSSEKQDYQTFHKHLVTTWSGIQV